MFELLRTWGVWGAALFYWIEREKGQWADYDVSDAGALNHLLATYDFPDWIGGEMVAIWQQGIAYPEHDGKPTDYVNVRSEPSTEQPPVGRLVAGMEVEFIDTGDVWWRVRSGDVTGWVHTDWVRIEPVAEPQPEPEPEPLPDPGADELARLREENAALHERIAELEEENASLSTRLAAAEEDAGRWWQFAELVRAAGTSF